MPSTSPVPALTIGFRRAEVGAFWMLTTGVLSLVLGAASAARGGAWAWGAFGLALPLPGLIWPQWFENGVRIWNKGARLSAAILRAYVLRVCYYLIFGAMGRTASSLDLRRRNAEVSRWIARAGIDVTVADRERGSADRGWWDRELMASARNPGQAWMVCLLPVVFLLTVLRDDEQESAVPSNTYTLY